MGRPATPWLVSYIQNKQSGGQHVGSGMECKRASQDKQENFQRNKLNCCWEADDEARRQAAQRSHVTPAVA